MQNRAIVYIDGLNFYYGVVKNTPYKWLNFESLFSKVIPQSFKVIKTKYFTSIVKSFPTDPQAPYRQKKFLEALNHTLNNFEIFYGSFSVNIKERYLETPIIDSSGNTLIKVKIINPEEKGSDVCLAVHLVNDAWLDLFDWAVVVSNDSDLAEALKLIKKHRKKILLIPTVSEKGENPLKKPAIKLYQYVDKIKYIEESYLRESQLPDVIPQTNIRKPPGW